MYLLREAQPGDLAGLKALAALLNSVNLPNDERALAGIIERSTRSFQGRIREPLERIYVFVLEEPRRRRVSGTSMVIAQHGTRESPCTFFNVSEREHYSSTLDRHFRHRVLGIGYHFDGPTEIGGLVVHPHDRGSEEQPGKQLSLVRFLYMAMFPERFRETVLAELMPPLLPSGKSLFWESCGKRFTGLGYQEADKRSRENKEFIQQLFPPGEIYATLFPPPVQKVLGAVGHQTEGARRMLERIGFRYVQRIDPFDGGPHYEARLADVSVVRDHRRLRLASAPLERHGAERLVGVVRPSGRVRLRAVRTQSLIDGDEVRLPAASRALLEVEPGDSVHLIPFGDHPPKGRAARTPRTASSAAGLSR
jgi:arginine N-succinyltransferase